MSVTQTHTLQIKDGSNLDDKKSIRTHWISLYVNVDNVACFDSFRVEYLPKEIRKFIDN